jgi:hypothetical protein
MTNATIGPQRTLQHPGTFSMLGSYTGPSFKDTDMKHKFLQKLNFHSLWWKGKTSSSISVSSSMELRAGPPCHFYFEDYTPG